MSQNITVRGCPRPTAVYALGAFGRQGAPAERVVPRASIAARHFCDRSEGRARGDRISRVGSTRRDTLGEKGFGVFAKPISRTSSQCRWAPPQNCSRTRLTGFWAVWNQRSHRLHQGMNEGLKASKLSRCYQYCDGTETGDLVTADRHHSDREFVPQRPRNIVELESASTASSGVGTVVFRFWRVGGHSRFRPDRSDFDPVKSSDDLVPIRDMD